MARNNRRLPGTGKGTVGPDPMGPHMKVARRVGYFCRLCRDAVADRNTHIADAHRHDDRPNDRVTAQEILPLVEREDGSFVALANGHCSDDHVFDPDIHRDECTACGSIVFQSNPLDADTDQ